MKHPNSQLQNAVMAPKIPMALSRRRLVGHVVLGSAAALVLTACGGGSSSTDDNTSAQEARLLSAYERLEEGMVWTDVEALVGFQANTRRFETLLVWEIGDVVLNVDFFSSGSKTISSATFESGSNPAISKSFNG